MVRYYLPIMNLLFLQMEEAMLFLNYNHSYSIYLKYYNRKYPNLKSIQLLGCDNLSGLPLDPEMLGMEADIICKVVET